MSDRAEIRRGVAADRGVVDFAGPDDFGRRVGVVIPICGRPAVLRRTLASLAASDLGGCAICLVDETLARAPPRDIAGFRRIENVMSAGHEIARVVAPRRVVAERAAADPRCVAFDDSGLLRHRLADRPTPMGNTRFSLYVRRSYIDAHRELAARYTDQPSYRPEPEAEAVAAAFAPPGVPVVRITKRWHGHMFDSLRLGLDLLSERCGVLMVLDADTVHHPDWVARTLAVHRHVQGRWADAPIITSGFHTRAHRTHRRCRRCRRYRTKRTIGGLHMTFSPDVYRAQVRPTLVTLGWDHDVCGAIEAAGGVIACTRPSVVQHIGEWGLWARPGRWMDRAEDFDDAAIGAAPP